MVGRNAKLGSRNLFAAQGAGIAAGDTAENHQRFEVVAEGAGVITVGRPEIDLARRNFQVGIAGRDTLADGAIPGLTHRHDGASI